MSPVLPCKVYELSGLKEDTDSEKSLHEIETDNEYPEDEMQVPPFL
jgi:hypothetical protein